MTSQDNELKSCDAVLRILEKRYDAKRTNVVRDTSKRPGVDVTCTIGDQFFALEHTLVEPFPNNTADDVSFVRVFDPAFEHSCDDLLRSDCTYNVWIDVYAFKGMGRPQLASVRQLLVDWLRGAIPLLPPLGEYRQAVVEGKPPSTPVRVVLGYHKSSILGGRLLPGRFEPPELDRLREIRVLKALNDKLPKLHAARRRGSRTVLVLENRDIALTNEVVVSQLIASLASKIDHMPDDIFLVNTGTGTSFFVTQIRDSGRPCLMMGDGNDPWEFKASDLDGPQEIG